MVALCHWQRATHGVRATHGGIVWITLQWHFKCHRLLYQNKTILKSVFISWLWLIHLSFYPCFGRHFLTYPWWHSYPFWHSFPWWRRATHGGRELLLLDGKELPIVRGMHMSNMLKLWHFKGTNPVIILIFSRDWGLALKYDPIGQLSGQFLSLRIFL